jgi:hypothetical protein
MKTFDDYDCLHRYIGGCPDCKKNYHNLHCTGYYPIRVMGNEALIHKPEQTRLIRSELEKMIQSTKQ